MFPLLLRNISNLKSGKKEKYFLIELFSKNEIYNRNYINQTHLFFFFFFFCFFFCVCVCGGGGGGGAGGGT